MFVRSAFLFGLLCLSLFADHLPDLRGPGGPIDDDRLDEAIAHARKAGQFDTVKELSGIRTTLDTSREAWKKGLPPVPCGDKLAHDKELPKVILTGERHKDENHLKHKAKIAADAKAGLLLRGVEGRQYRPITAENLKTGEAGYDDAFTSGLTALMNADVLAHTTKDALGKSLQQIELFGVARQNPFLKEAWNELLKSPGVLAKDAILPYISERLNDADEGATMAAQLSFKLKQPTHSWNQGGASYINVLHRWMEIYADMALSPKYRDAHLTPPNLRSLVDRHTRGIDLALPMQVIVIEWRNRFVARNIVALYCDLIERGANLPLNIIIGAFHVPGLEQILRAALPRRVEIVRDGAFPQAVPKAKETLDAEQDRILKQLRDLKSRTESQRK